MRSHSTTKDCRCTWPGCTYACATKGHLVRHMRVHTGENRRGPSGHSALPFAAPIGIFHINENGVRYDDSTALAPGEKPYKCQWPGCQYAASQSGHLSSHQQMHEQGGRGADDGRSSRALAKAKAKTGGQPLLRARGGGGGVQGKLEVAEQGQGRAVAQAAAAACAQAAYDHAAQARQQAAAQVRPRRTRASAAPPCASPVCRVAAYRDPRAVTPLHRFAPTLQR